MLRDNPNKKEIINIIYIAIIEISLGNTYLSILSIFMKSVNLFCLT